MRVIKKGATDQSTVIRIIDDTTGVPETAVEHNTSGIDLWYRREAATKTSITEAALAALDSAHADGGIEHIGDGYYRLDLPDAAFATGANGVAIGGTVTGMVVIGSYHPLVDYDPQDTVRLGLTALPNAAADAAGGLAISDAGGLDLDAQRSDVAAILVDTGTTLDGRLPAALVGGRIDANMGAISTDSVAADNAEAFFDGTGYAGTGNTIPTVTTATNVTTVNGLAANVITAASMAADASAEIADAVWDEDATGHQTQGTFGQAIGDPVADTNTIFKAVVTDATGATVGVDAAAILDDTGTSGVVVSATSVRTAVGMASANLDTQLTAIDDFLDTEIAAIKAKTDNLPADPADASDIAAAIAALNDLSAAEINAEVVDALATDTYTEITGVPGWSVPLSTMIRRIYASLVNPVDVTSSKKTFKNAAGSGQWSKTLADDGSTYSETVGGAP